MTNDIKQLSAEVANQIAAGEVVEGPSSVIKELVENSVDAGADQVIIEVESAGKTKIVVSDNGIGVAKAQLPQLLRRHCTSKLTEIADLNHIISMGFRGEALASIASVSRMRVRTRVEGDDHGWQLFCEGDSSEVIDIKPYEQPMPVGTVMEVRDLFFRVPARQKNFLESDQSAMRNIKAVVKKMILAHPKVTITLKTPEKTLLHAEACQEITQRLDRLSVVFGKDFAQAAIFINEKLPWGQLIGWCAQPFFNRRYTDMQALLINSRPIRDKKLAFAVKRAYQDVMLPGRHPAFCLYLEMDPELVDVNVHPSKEKVRFARLEDITRGLKYTIEQSLRGRMHINKDQVDLADRIGGIQTSPVAGTMQSTTPLVTSSVATADNGLQMASSVTENESNEQPESGSAAPVFSAPVSAQDLGHRAHPEMKPAALAIPCEDIVQVAEPHVPVTKRFDVKDVGLLQNDVATQPSHADANADVYSLGFALGQLHGLYVLAQNKDGLVIIDMHAAHERILYEQLKSSYAAQGVATQALLVPYRCQLTVEAQDIVNQYGVLLLQMGLELTVTESGEVMLHAIPAVLAKQNLDGLVQDVIQELAEYQTSDHMQSALHEIFASMACHGAIRANRVLSIAEMNALLRQIEKTASSDYCNHGRPTWFVWDMARIDAVFRRGQ